MQPSPLIPARGRFLHLIPDDKFIDAARGVFEEAFPGAHDYLVIGQPPLRYLRTFAPTCMQLDRALDPKFLSSLQAYSTVFVHFLSDQARLIVASAPAATRFVWLGWGADFYHLIETRDKLWLPKTRSLLSSLHRHKSRAHDAWTRASSRLRRLAQPGKFARLFAAQLELRRIGKNAPGELALINRFGAIATPIFEDFEAIRRRNPGVRVPFLDWNYRVEGFNEHGGPTSPSGNDILLGNSATPENNHVEALEILSQCLPAGRRIVCPLSYGNKDYGDAIEQRGKALFGERFVALREYMPSSAYVQIVESCSVLIMNHIRQQALGNIVIALCSGARVFLNPDSPINRTMQRIGIKVGTTNSLPDFFAKAEVGVTLIELQFTRKKIEDHFGRASVLHRTRTLLNKLR